jgi:hypothetical protein
MKCRDMYNELRTGEFRNANIQMKLSYPSGFLLVQSGLLGIAEPINRMMTLTL